MRVLVVHNRYRSSLPSGENMAVDADVESLRSCGVDVVPWMASSDELLEPGPFGLPLSAAAAALGPVVGMRERTRVERYVESSRPDVVHMHNLYPHFSPALICSLSRKRIPIVQTVHNYRRTCAKGTLFRGGAPCVECETSGAIRAVRHACYQNSRTRSIPMAASQVLHRSSWNSLDRHIALTQFQASWLVSQGIDESRVVVRPTPMPDREWSSMGPSKRLSFIGRLDGEKGVDVLLDAWRRSGLANEGWTLDVVGDGPLSVELRTQMFPSVEFHGRLGADAVLRTISNSVAVVIPSLVLEGFPRVAAEAFQQGRPVLALDNPNMRAVVGDCGWLSGKNQLPAALLEARNLEWLRGLGERARVRFSKELEERESTRSLISMYEEIILERARGGNET